MESVVVMIKYNFRKKYRYDAVRAYRIKVAMNNIRYTRCTKIARKHKIVYGQPVCAEVVFLVFDT